MQPTLQANACRAVTKALCAVQAPRRLRAAFLNCWGSCTPLAYFFLLLKKSRSPKASEATNNALGLNALDKHRMIRTECLFLISRLIDVSKDATRYAYASIPAVSSASPARMRCAKVVCRMAT